MANPNAVSDSNGEWFEIFNASMTTVNLNGLIIGDNGSNSHTINASGSLLVAPGDYFVLGNNRDAASNGGYIPDYVYSGFSLANSSDQIVILDGTTEITRLEYSGTPFGVSGLSAELINQNASPQAEDYATTPANSTFQFGDGDFGTPGTAGSVMLAFQTPVPVPATIWFLGSALLVLMRKFIAPANCGHRAINL